MTKTQTQTLEQRLDALLVEQADATRRYEDAQARRHDADMLAIRAELRAIEDRIAVLNDQRTHAAAAATAAAARAERERRRAGLARVAALIGAHAAIAQDLDELLDQLGAKIDAAEALETEIVDEFREHCEHLQLRDSFVKIGLAGHAVPAEVYSRLFGIQPLRRVLERFGADAPNWSRPPSVKQVAADCHRRALYLNDQALAHVAEPDREAAA